MMTLITFIRKWEKGRGFLYTTEYDKKEMPDMNLEEGEDLVAKADITFSDALIKNEPITVDFECWHELIDQFGQSIAESGHFWARDEHNCCDDHTYFLKPRREQMME